MKKNEVLVIEDGKSGFTPAQAKLFLQIKENQKLIDNCSLHQFEKEEPPYNLNQKFKCKNCGGKIDVLYAFYYAKGYEAAGKDPNEIIPDFRNVK